MIEVNLSVWITAKDDAEADRVIRALAERGRYWPETPVVSIDELSRELKRDG
jgi:hypothetical protein